MIATNKLEHYIKFSAPVNNSADLGVLIKNDHDYRSVLSGIYYLHLEAGSQVATRKIVYLRWHNI
jgi:hypothetical protein